MSDDQPSAAPDDPGRDPPRLTGRHLEGVLETKSESGDDGARFRNGALLGSGGIGRVLAIEDRNLQREIAVKTLLPDQSGDSASVAALITEARITSSLEHPGIVPVHDLDVSADGQIYYAMRRIHGRSLGALVAEAQRTGERPPAIADANALVTILLKVCDALGYAHSRGVVHRDLKPDNIMIGEFGEVLVLDWGASSILPGAGRGPSTPSDQYGTPAFMSPEQARGETIDPRSDVWSLGATLFNVLFLRFPLAMGDDEAAFWAGKRAGAISPPLADELHALNRPLAATALRAMAADPAQRYQDVTAFADDLRAYQAGRAMVAYRGSPWERLRRWHQRWGRTCWTTAAVLLVIAAAAWFVWGERLKQIATWGAPVLSEEFVDESWRARWMCEPPTAFAVRDGRLLSAAGTAAVTWCRRPLAGPVAIEYDAEITPGSRPCDLSVLWRNGDLDPAQTGFPQSGWAIQAGAYDNSFCAIYRITDSRHDQVARQPVRLVPGKVHRIRVEIDGSTLRLLVDGATAATYEDALPIRPGHIGLYAYYPGKAFDHLRLHAKGVAERISPIELGDDCLHDGLYARAIERYRRVLTSHPQGPLADEAWYKIGHSRQLAGDVDGAWDAWRRVAAPPFSDRVACNELDRLFGTGRHDELLARLAEVAGRSPVARSQVEALWAKWADQLLPWNLQPHRPELLERYLAIRRQVFPGTGPSVSAYGRGLHALRRYRQVVDQCGDDPLSVVDALQSLGLPDEGRRRFPQMHWWAAHLNEQAGDLEPNLSYVDGAERGIALAKMGRVDEALREKPGRADWRITAAAGDWPALLARPADLDGYRMGLVGTGRVAEAAAGRFRSPAEPWALARALLGQETRGNPALSLLASLHAGDRAGIARWRRATAEQPIDWNWPTEWFGATILVPFLAHQDGDAQAWTRAMEQAMSMQRRSGQRLWHFAALISGKIPTERFLAQPYRAEATAWLHLATALRAEIDGNAPAAHAAYRAFQALPLEMRLLEDFTFSPVVERFVAWRLQQPPR